MVISAFFQRLRRFLLSEYFTDALRITLSVVLPVCVLYSLGFAQAAITVGLGALNIGLTESAGTAADKKIGMLISIPLSFLVSLVVASSWPHPVLLAVVFSVIVFTCSMFTVYGLRFSMLGISLIGLAIFSWGLKPANGLIFSLYILAGSIWYYLISYLYIKIWPLRSLKHAIGECLTATAEFLHAKAPFYDTDVPLDISYKKLLALHVRINDKQELVRNLLLRDSHAMRADNSQGQELIKITSCAIDLYDQITAIHYDYEFVRENFKVNGVLELVHKVIKVQAQELHAVSDALHTNKRLGANDRYLKDIQLLLDRLQYIIERESSTNVAMLIKLKHNIEQIDEYIKAIKTGLFNHDAQLQYAHFVSVQDLSFTQFKNNLNLKSPIFRFALRLTVACMFGFGLSYIFKLGNYSYWVLLTILVIMRPSFNITQKRNKQRLIGSVAGIVGGFGVLLLIPLVPVQLGLAILLLVGFLAFLRTNYMVAVIFITSMVVICLNIYTGQNSNIVIERVYDTILGCVIAFLGAYLFPVWESKRLGFYVKEVLESNIAYLEKLYDEVTGSPADVTAYKLSRKRVYTSLASLSGAFAGMQSEPRRSVEKERSVYRFQVLNFRLSSMITSLFSAFRLKPGMVHHASEMTQISETISTLKHSLQKMNQHLVTAGQGDNSQPSSSFSKGASEGSGDFLLLQLATEIKECSRQLV